jgi:hypothetical protein
MLQAGLLSDKKVLLNTFMALFFLPGVFVLMIPLQAFVLKAALPSVSFGAFQCHSCSSPSLFSRCVSPCVIKICGERNAEYSRTVGFFTRFQRSEVLSVRFTGFILSRISVNQIFSVIGTILICLSAGYFMFSKKIFRLGLHPPAIVVSIMAMPRSPNSEKRTKVTNSIRQGYFYGNEGGRLYLKISTCGN